MSKQETVKERNPRKTPLQLSTEQIKSEFPQMQDRDVGIIAKYLTDHTETEGEKLAKSIDAKIRSAFNKGKTEGKKGRKSRGTGKGKQDALKKREKSLEQKQKELQKAEEHRKALEDKIKKEQEELEKKRKEAKESQPSSEYLD